MITSEETRDGIRELVNIGVGRAVGLIQELTGVHVVRRIPDLDVLTPGEPDQTHLSQSRDLSVVRMKYCGDLQGVCALTLPHDSARRLVYLLTGEEARNDDAGMILEETLCEVGNMLINAVMGSIANITRRSLTYDLPVYTENSLASLVSSGVKEPGGDPGILARTGFRVTSPLIEGDILLFLDSRSILLLDESIASLIGPVR